MSKYRTTLRENFSPDEARRQLESEWVEDDPPRDFLFPIIRTRYPDRGLMAPPLGLPSAGYRGIRGSLVFIEFDEEDR